MIKVQVDKVWLGKVSVRDYIYKNEVLKNILLRILKPPFLVKKCVGSLTDFSPCSITQEKQ